MTASRLPSQVHLDAQPRRCHLPSLPKGFNSKCCSQNLGRVIPRAEGNSAALKDAKDLIQRASQSDSQVPNGSTPPSPGQDVGPKVEIEPVKKETGIAFRRSLNKTGRYQRNPLNDAVSLALMEEHGVGYSSAGLIAQMRNQGNRWTQNDVQVILAEAYGYCWGVERAVQMAYEARKQYPERKMHITNEIIHNPAVNQRLKEMDLEIIEDQGTGKDFSHVKQDDVVILPAFGASVSEMKLLNDRGVQIVDTTCPWVSKVWNAVDNQAKKSHTSIIHGKYSHEETIATASFATIYLIIRDLNEAKYVANYINNGGDRAEFLEKFKNAISEGFDPDTDLTAIGLANQTTMLRNETMEIGKLLERTMMEKYGPAELKKHYMVMDTICDATQERQDAVTQMVQADKKPDMMLVVGGFNSSNTSHLQEIPEMNDVPSFWVNSAACVDVARNHITHKTAHGEMVETCPWLPEGPITIGVTSGASTPDRAVEDVLDQVFRIKDPSFQCIPQDQALLEAAIANRGKKKAAH